MTTTANRTPANAKTIRKGHSKERCPECDSTHVKFIARDGALECLVCEHQWLSPPPADQLVIFKGRCGPCLNCGANKFDLSCYPKITCLVCQCEWQHVDEGVTIVCCLPRTITVHDQTFDISDGVFADEDAERLKAAAFNAYQEVLFAQSKLDTNDSAEKNP